MIGVQDGSLGLPARAPGRFRRVSRRQEAERLTLEVSSTNPHTASKHLRLTQYDNTDEGEIWTAWASQQEAWEQTSSPQSPKPAT